MNEQREMTITITIVVEDGGKSRSHCNFNGISPEIASIFMLEIATNTLKNLAYSHAEMHTHNHKENE